MFLLYQCVGSTKLFSKSESYSLYNGLGGKYRTKNKHKCQTIRPNHFNSKAKGRSRPRSRSELLRRPGELRRSAFGHLAWLVYCSSPLANTTQFKSKSNLRSPISSKNYLKPDTCTVPLTKCSSNIRNRLKLPIRNHFPLW